MPTEAEAKLEAIRKQWKNIKPLEGISGNVPDGVYQCVLGKVSLKETMRAVFTFKILRGEYAGKTINIVNDILRERKAADKPSGAEIFCTTLHKLGTQVPDLTPSVIGKVMDRAVGTVVDLSVSHATVNGRTYQNAFIQTLISGPASIKEKVKLVTRPAPDSQAELEVETSELDEEENKPAVYQYFDKTTSTNRNVRIIKEVEDGKLIIEAKVGKGIKRFKVSPDKLKEIPQVENIVNDDEEEDEDWEDEIE